VGGPSGVSTPKSTCLLKQNKKHLPGASIKNKTVSLLNLKGGISGSSQCNVKDKFVNRNLAANKRME